MVAVCYILPFPGSPEPAQWRQGRQRSPGCLGKTSSAPQHGHRMPWSSSSIPRKHKHSKLQRNRHILNNDDDDDDLDDDDDDDDDDATYRRMHTYAHRKSDLPPHCVRQNILRQRRAGKLARAVFSKKSIETTSKRTEKTCPQENGTRHVLACINVRSSDCSWIFLMTQCDFIWEFP